jgi:hypothetical protein
LSARISIRLLHSGIQDVNKASDRLGALRYTFWRFNLKFKEKFKSNICMHNEEREENGN